MKVVQATESLLRALKAPVAPWMHDFALAALTGPSRHRLRDFSRALLLPSGYPLCVWGIVPQRVGVAEVWAVVDQAARCHRDTVYHFAALHLSVVERGLGLRRLAAPIKANFEVGLRFAEKLGFNREGLMVNFGPGGQGDYYLYARCR
jgi:hypothetical protein